MKEAQAQAEAAGIPGLLAQSQEVMTDRRELRTQLSAAAVASDPPSTPTYIHSFMTHV